MAEALLHHLSAFTQKKREMPCNGNKMSDQELTAEIPERLTLLITTAPAIANPSTHILERQLQSIIELGLAPCHVVLCFDGNEVDHQDPLLDVKCKRLGSSEDLDKYDRYKTAAKEVAQRMLPRVSFTEAPRRMGLTHNLREGFNLVRTKYVFVIQDDLVLVKPVDFAAILQSMEDTPKVKLVRFSWGRNRIHQDVMHKHYSPVTTPDAEMTSRGITLSRASQFSDNNHITSAEYYHSLVFPITLKKLGFMEHDLVDLPARGLGAHSVWGTWYYGAYDDGDYLYHLDARNWRG